MKDELIKIYLPKPDDFVIKEYEAFVEHYGCKISKGKKAGHFMITTDDPLNLFWLGANWNNSYLNELLKEIQQLKAKKTG